MPAPFENESEMHRAFAALLAGERPKVSSGPFVEWAEHHRLAPLAHLLATQAGSSLASDLRRSRVLAGTAEALRSGWTAELLTAICAAGTTPIVFKGLGVAHSHYPSPELRILGDLDLLVRRPELARAIAGAQSVGFRHSCGDPLAIAYHLDEQYHVPMVGGSHHLELHHALYRECRRRFLDDVLTAAEPVVVLGVQVQQLAAEDLFIVLAVHWATSNPGSLWGWLLDLHLIARSLDDSRWQKLARRAIEHGLASFVLLALDALANLWQLSLAPEPVRDRLAASLRPPEQWLRRTVALRLRRGPINGDLVRGVHRLSLRPTAGRLGPLRAVLPHGGATVIELGVASNSPWFPLHRARHVLIRSRRAGRSLLQR